MSKPLKGLRAHWSKLNAILAPHGARAAKLAQRCIGTWIVFFALLLFITVWLICFRGHFTFGEGHQYQLLNLIVSIGSAFTIPIILISQNHQDRENEKKEAATMDLLKKMEERLETQTRLLEELIQRDRASK